MHASRIQEHDSYLAQPCRGPAPAHTQPAKRCRNSVHRFRQQVLCTSPCSRTPAASHAQLKTPIPILGLLAFELWAMHFVEVKRYQDFVNPG